MATTRPRMAGVAIFIALLAQLQPVLASFYTVTTYYVLTPSPSKAVSTCTSSCRTYTYTDTLTVKPNVTPTASPYSSTTYTYTYDDLEVVRLFVSADAVASSDLLPTTTSTRTSGEGYAITNYVVPVTWTAPTSCPTPFTVTTVTIVDVPYQVTAHISAVSTQTSLYVPNTRTPSTNTYVTILLDATAVPATEIGNPTSNYYYTYYVANCRNPTATGSAYYGPTYTAGSGGYRSGGGDDDDYTVCSVMTGCVALATWIIVVATILPCIFLIGFIESYCWFRRMMLGQSALRLGTVCWCCLSLWFILLTRKSHARSKEDQVLLKQYWATLGAGTRIKLWFKWGFRHRYPVELLGNPDGSPVVVAAPAVVNGQGAPPPPGDGTEKTGVNGAQVQPVYYPPYPGQQGYYPQQPYPGQQPYGQPGAFQPGFAPPPGYMMVPVPQGGQPYVPGQPGFAPTPPPQGVDGQQQQQYPPYVPTPSPVQTATTEVPSMHPSPPPAHELQQPPPAGQPPHQQPQQPPQPPPAH